MKFYQNQFKLQILFYLMPLFIGVACVNNNANDVTSKQPKDNETVKKNLDSISPDPINYSQYVSCEIDGQPYVAYYAPDHISNITTTINTTTRISFSSSADQVKIGNETKISELSFNFFNVEAKGKGTYTSSNDFTVDGHTDFLKNGKLEYVSFIHAANQTINITAFKDGFLEGKFNIDVVSEKDSNRILKITNGKFKIEIKP